MPLSPETQETADQEFMLYALQEASVAATEDEVPVGAIIVQNSRILARAHNQRERLQDPTAHAEMIAITQASAALGNWRLQDCTLYVTLEPCPMCAGAILQARVPRVVYAASDPKAGACRSLYQLLSDSRLNHQVEVIPGIEAQKASELLTSFFQGKRREKQP